MASTNELLELIKPVLLKVCEYNTFKQNGVEVKHAEVLNDLNALFAVIKKAVDRSEYLSKKYVQVEKPLVFFVDYIIKESKFSFSREYEPLARRYNELSGDDKFFDILDYTLEDKSADKDVLQVFYILLGLGFDGAYKREPKEVVNRIYECQRQIGDMLNPVKETLFPEVQEKINNKGEETGRLAIIRRHPYIAAILLLVFCFTLNLFSIYEHVGKYNDMIQAALRDASPYKNMARATVTDPMETPEDGKVDDDDDDDDDDDETENMSVSDLQDKNASSDDATNSTNED